MLLLTGRQESAHKAADEECNSTTDEDVPSKCDWCESPNAEDNSQAGEHADGGAGAVGFLVERAEKKEAEKTAEGKRGDGEARFKERTPGHEAEGDQNGAPDECHAAGETEKLLRIGLMAPETGEIENRGSSERIERPASVGHGDSEDRGEKNSGEAGGHFADEEGGQDGVGALTGCEQRSVLRKDEEKHADEKKKRELKKYDKAGRNECSAAVAFIFCGEKTLDDSLVGAVACHGKKSAADEAGPERVFGGKGKGEIEELKFVAGNGGDLGDFGPTAGNAVEKKEESDGAAGEIQEELGDIGPDDGFHAAFEGVKDCEGDDEEDSEAFGCAEDDADHERDGGDANTFGNGARDEKGGGCERAHAWAEAFFDERVGSEEFAAEIAGEEKQHDENAADEIAEDELKKGEIAAVGDGGCTDDGERGGFRGNDGEGDGPPRRSAAAEEVIADILLAAAEIDAECGDGKEVGKDDDEVEGMDVHEVRRG